MLALMGMLLVSFCSSHDYQSRSHSHLWLKNYFSTFIGLGDLLHPSKHFCTEIYTHSPYNILKMVRKFEVHSLNLHLLSGKGFLF